MPELPSLEEDLGWATGPHDTSNYVLPGRLLAGSYPGGRSESEHVAKLRALLAAGVDTFVCLQETRELHSRFRPYIGTLRRLSGEREGKDDCDPLDFWHCPIPDGHITTTHQLEAAVATIVDRLKAGRVVYVHCWGGHGRTGTVIAALLVKVYGLTVDQARDFFMATHGQRRVRGGGGPGHWPHSERQYRQVKDLEGLGPELSGKRLAPLEDWTL